MINKYRERSPGEIEETLGYIVRRLETIREPHVKETIVAISEVIAGAVSEDRSDVRSAFHAAWGLIDELIENGDFQGDDARMLKALCSEMAGNILLQDIYSGELVPRKFAYPATTWHDVLKWIRRLVLRKHDVISREKCS